MRKNRYSGAFGQPGQPAANRLPDLFDLPWRAGQENHAVHDRQATRDRSVRRPGHLEPDAVALFLDDPDVLARAAARGFQVQARNWTRGAGFSTSKRSVRSVPVAK